MSLDDPVIITCSISGSLAGREQCPAIPYTPEEYGAEARRIVEEGGVMIHVHARTPAGAPSYEVEDFAAITAAIRAQAGDVIVNYSTGAVGVPVAKRAAYLRALKPDVAALNMGSMNYAKYSPTRRDFVFQTVFANPFDEIVELLSVMNEHSIRPEHECFDLGHVGSLAPLIDMGMLSAPLHVSCVLGVTGGAAPTARNLAAMADNVPAGAHWSVIGISRVQWMLVAAALTLGGSVRVGLEDNFYLPDGTMARSNGELVARARRLTEDVGRRPATVAQAREMLGLPPAMSLALEDVRVLDLSRLLPGGFCSLLLADLGADVLKVEDTGMGDYIRWAPPAYEGAARSARSALFLALNRNKRSIRIDLKQPAGRDVLLRLVAEHDVVLESFRPGVLDRLGAGYEAMRAVNPRIVYCAITGYGQDGPLRDRPGHDLNYLGLVGLLGLTGEPGGAPVQSAGQIADLGGGALMAALGILAALRERDRSGQGQLVDVSMADGALSWLAMVAARQLAGDDAPARGELELGGGLVCYRPYACADGWVTFAALEPKFWAAWCHGVGREDLLEHHLAGPGSDAHAEVEAIFRQRTRAQWSRFAGEVECCVEPVLDLDEALDSEQTRARGMVVDLDQPGAQRPVRLLGAPVKLSRTPADTARRPGPVLGEHTAAVLREAGYAERDVAALLACGAVAGPARDGDPAPRVGPLVSAPGLLKMRELAERSGVSVGTIKHYLREGLLGGDEAIVRTSRNMAYYPPDFVERIRLIKRLQEERYMPLKLIKGFIESDPERVRALVELEDRILERAVAAQEGERVSAAEVARRYDLPPNVLDRLAEIEVLSPRGEGYDADDVRIIAAISRFRAGGYDEALGFTVYETLRYREALQPLVEQEVRALLDRLAGEVEPDRAAQIIAAGAEPLRDLIGALHAKLLLAELRRQRGA